MNWLDNVYNQEIIGFVQKHKGRYNEINVIRGKYYGEMIEVRTEIYGRYDEGDKIYSYFFGPYGEMMQTDNGFELKPFDDEAKDWALLMYNNNKNIAYLEGFKLAHKEAIFNLEKTECSIVDAKVKELLATKTVIAKKKEKNLASLSKFISTKLDLVKNDEQNSLIVKAFLSNMTPEERDNWLAENGFKQNVTAENNDVEDIVLKQS